MFNVVVMCEKDMKNFMGGHLKFQWNLLKKQYPFSENI